MIFYLFLCTFAQFLAVNECLRDEHNCSLVGSICIDTPQRFYCECDATEGYSGDGTQCDKVDPVCTGKYTLVNQIREIFLFNTWLLTHAFLSATKKKVSATWSSV